MASSSTRKGGSDRVVESRHLVGLFLGVVLLCGVFFTLGYVMGRTQYGSSTVRAAAAGTKETLASSPAPKKESPVASSSSDSPEWDFYSSKNPENHLPSSPAVVHETQPSSSVPAAKSVAAPMKSIARYRPPKIPHGAFLLQVAAMKGEGDALALTDALQQKQFPAFVVTPSADNLYRVQVGPYSDAQSASLAKRSLEREGFKAIIKH